MKHGFYNYHTRMHGDNFRSKSEPKSVYAPKRFDRLNERMWFNLVCNTQRGGCAGGVNTIWTCDSIRYPRVRKINYGKTLGWWAPYRDED